MCHRQEKFYVPVVMQLAQKLFTVLAAWRLNQCRTTSLVAPLAASRVVAVPYQVASLAFKVLSSSAPAFLSHLINTAVTVWPPASDACSAVLLVTALHAWEPSHIRSRHTVLVLKRHFITHWFRQSKPEASSPIALLPFIALHILYYH